MKNVLVIGESCVDEFVYCKTERLSPEAPVPVLVPLKKVSNEGMVGNVCNNLRSLNSNLQIARISQNEIITKTRYVDEKSNHLFVRVDEGENSITPFRGFDDYESFDIVIVSDYNKGFLSNEDLETIGKNSRLSILDSKRKLTKEVIDSFTFVKLNESEAKENQTLVSNNNLLITLGKNGCQYKDKIYKSPDPKDTIDVSGAGDTFTASFILKYFETKDIEVSINFANEMSSIVVSKKGVVTPF